MVNSLENNCFAENVIKDEIYDSIDAFLESLRRLRCNRAARLLKWKEAGGLQLLTGRFLSVR